MSADKREEREEREEIEDAIVEAALEIELGGQAGADLTRRILEAAEAERVFAPPARKRRPGRPGRPGRAGRAGRPGRRQRRAPRAAALRTRPVTSALAAAAVLLLCLLGALRLRDKKSAERRDDSAKLDTPKRLPAPALRPLPAPAPPAAAPPASTLQPSPPADRDAAPPPGSPLSAPRPAPPRPSPLPLPPARPPERSPRSEPRPKPKEPLRSAVLARVIGGGDVKAQAAPGEGWASLEDGAPVLAGSRLSTRGGAADLELPGGGLLRFDGRIRLDGDGAATRVTVIGTEVYLDNMDAGSPVELTAAAARLCCESGVLLLSRSRSDQVVIACLAGNVKLAERAMKAGTAIRVSRSGKTSKAVALELAQLRGLFKRVLGRLPERGLWREDFESRPRGLEKGRVAGGVARCEGDGSSLELDFPSEQTVTLGLVLRFRLRVTDARDLYLQCWEPEARLNFRVAIRPLQQGRFQIVEVSLRELRQSSDERTLLGLGARLRNVQLHVSGRAKARVELDWMELVRRPGG